MSATMAQGRQKGIDGGGVMPIAIVGMGCRYPGGAINPEKLWDMCAEQRDAWSPIPKERFNADEVYHPDPSRNGTSNVKGAHFLNEHPGYFDAQFFNLTQAEASAMDPQQRILLECSYEALENAGITINHIAGSDTAVFVGSSCRDYADLLSHDLDRTELYQSTGTGSTMLANRISYFYDLKGPSIAVDTACSSSLVALHLACSALRSGESKMAIVGGSNLILGPAATVALSMLRFLSPDGRCFSFDERGNGFGRGEGAACLVLKPLDDALKAGDTIRAVIRNSGTNQDGKTSGITLPSGPAQIQLIQKLYKQCGLDPTETSYIEAHGTGTQAGDPIEASSLAKIFTMGKTEDELVVGSIKSNIGHLEGGSGMAGVVKTVLMLEKGLILPNFEFTKANPRITLNDWKIKIPTALLPWTTSHTRRASVNNFGFGGSNAHVIIEESRSHPTRDSDTANGHLMNGTTVSRRQNGKDGQRVSLQARLFVLSAHDALAGQRQAATLLSYLQRRQNHPTHFLDKLAFTLCERRTVHPWRANFAATSMPQLLESLCPENVKYTKAMKNVSLGFVFTGQGAQWYGMGRELILRYPIFQESLLRSEKCLKSFGASWSLMVELMRDAETSCIGSALLSQPLCTAIQVALVDLLASWNIKPASVSGHSSGEIAAAYAAGVLSQESALAVSYHRGVVSSEVKHVKDLQAGSMLAVGLSAEETSVFISNVKDGTVTIACLNSPSSVTVSGDESGINELLQTIKEAGAFARKLAVDTAYHSHHMRYVAESYLRALGDIPITSSEGVEIYSSVTGKKIQPSELDAEYWVANLVSPVQFSQSIQNLCLGSGSKRRKRRGAKASVDILLEIGPHSALSGPIKQNLQANNILSSAGIEYLSVLIRNQNAVETSLGVAGGLFSKGADVDLRRINYVSGGHDVNNVLIDVPPYPWYHSTLYWASALPTPTRLKETVNFPRNDFLGTPVKTSSSLEPQWRNFMRTSEIPWLNDHVIQSNTVCPAACYLAMAIEAAYQQATIRGIKAIGYRFRELTIGRALVFSQALDEVETMLSLRPYNESIRITSDAWDEFCVSSSNDGATWTEHCRGLISVEITKPTTEVDGGREVQEQTEDYIQIRSSFNATCTKEISSKEIYAALKELGLNFGPTFTNMQKVRIGGDKCVAEVCIPDTAAIMPAKFEYPFILHPATLDSFIHGVFPVKEGYKFQDQGTPVPTFIAEMYVSHNVAKEPGHSFTMYAKGEHRDLGNSASKGLGRTSNNLVVFDSALDGSEPIVTVTGLAFSTLPRESSGKSEQAEKLCHRIEWNAAPEFLTAEQIEKLASPFRLPLEVEDMGELVQQAGFYYAENAVKTVSIEEIPETEPHLRKLYSVVKRSCEDAYSGHMGIFPTSQWLTLDAVARKRVCDTVRETAYEILYYIGEALPQILRNEVDPLSILMEDSRLDRHYRENQLLSQSYDQVAVYLQILSKKNPFLNVLEIGAGTGGATFPALEAMTGPDGPQFANYDFTDISPGFFEKIKEKIQQQSSQLADLISYKRLDIESDPKEQGFELGSYDLIIAANVLHATKIMENTMARVRSLLKPGGKLILIEITVKNLAAALVFGLLPGWWVGEEPRRQDYPLLTEEEWNYLLLKSGFSGLDNVLWDIPQVENHTISSMISTAREDTKPTYPTEITIATEATPPEPCVAELQEQLHTLGVSSSVSTLADCDPKGQACIVLSELTQLVLRDPTPETFAATQRIFLESSGTLWVTRGAQMESSNPDANLVTGITRTIRAEKGDTMLVTLDLDPQTPDPSQRSIADVIFKVFERNFCLGSTKIANLDTEYVVRDDVFMIPRVVQDQELTSFVAPTTGIPVPVSQPFVQLGRPLVAEIKIPGFLDSLQFVDDQRTIGPIPDNNVEFEVMAIGLNFRDVMSASGQIDPYSLGCECSGVITVVGKSVEDFAVGDHVIGNVLGGCVCTTVRAPSVAVEHVPHDMPFEIAASLPIVYFTAFYAIMKVARLAKGETILIHAASGGLGQALINLAQLVGAEIFATVGTLEKKQLLIERFNIPEDHIFSSRDDTFAKGVMRRTGGRGVDVIMNSLSGDALRQTWNCIAAFGRFVELGKRDFTVNSRLEMKNFEKNVSFTGLDVPLHTHFDEKRRIWGKIMKLYQQGDIKPPYPLTTFGISEVEKAMRIMQSGKHSGKLVIFPRPHEIVKVLPKKDNGNFLIADASYLLVGGLGGIGRALALWMAERGAKHLISASRSGLRGEKAQECVALLKEKGVNIKAFRCDVTNVEDVQEMVEECGRTMPPIRGMIHTAMVPKANLFENLSLADYNATIGVKVHGTWNLHNALSRSSLDFFILLSSMVGTIGNPSQAAYVAANLFLDAFANFRNAKGLPAVALALGRVVDIGFVSENEEMQRATNHLWSRDVTPEEVFAVIESAVKEPMRKGRAGSSIVGMKEWGPEASPTHLAPLFNHYRRATQKSKSARGQGGGTGDQLREMLKNATVLDDAATKTCNAVMAKMSALLMIPLEDISSNKSMSTYGMDSLVAVEMRNWLVRELDVTLPVLELLANTSLAVLAKKIVLKSKYTNPAIFEGKGGLKSRNF